MASVNLYGVDPQQVRIDLDADTGYLWQVIAKNNLGQAPGPVWMFSTQGPLPPDPPIEPSPQ